MSSVHLYPAEYISLTHSSTPFPSLQAISHSKFLPFLQCSHFTQGFYIRKITFYRNKSMCTPFNFYKLSSSRLIIINASRNPIFASRHLLHQSCLVMIQSFHDSIILCRMQSKYFLTLKIKEFMIVTRNIPHRCIVDINQEVTGAGFTI